MTSEKEQKNWQLETVGENSKQGESRELILQNLESIINEQEKALITVRQTIENSKKSGEQTVKITQIWTEQQCYICQRNIKNKSLIGQLLGLEITRSTYREKVFCIYCWEKHCQVERIITGNEESKLLQIIKRSIDWEKEIEERQKISNQIQEWKQEQDELRKKAQANAKLNSPREIHLEELVSEHKNKAREWANKNEQSKQEISELAGRIKELEQELSSMTNTAEQLKKAKEQLREEHDNLLRRWELKGNLLLANEALVKGLEISLKNAEARTEREKEYRQKDKELHEQENQNWQNAANKWKKDREEWKDLMDERLERIYKQTDNISELECQAVDYRSTIDSKEGEINNLTTEKNQLKIAKRSRRTSPRQSYPKRAINCSW